MLAGPRISKTLMNDRLRWGRLQGRRPEDALPGSPEREAVDFLHAAPAHPSLSNQSGFGAK